MTYLNHITQWLWEWRYANRHAYRHPWDTQPEPHDWWEWMDADDDKIIAWWEWMDEK